MSYTNGPRQGTRGYSPRNHGGRGHHRHASQNTQGSNVQNEPQPTSTRGSQSGRFFYRGRGHAFSERGANNAVSCNYGRGQQHRVNRGYHSARRTSDDVRNSFDEYSGTRGGKARSTWAKSAKGRPLPIPQHVQFLDFPFIKQQETVRQMQQFQVMFILRGLPGSGKSTVAQAILQQYKSQAVICSADYYRYNKDGEYIWDVDRLQETHAKCQRRAEKFAGLNKPVIIIDNTNVRYFEVEPYIKLSKQYSYVAVLVEPRTPWKFQARELTTRNTHNVSFVKISKKVEQYDDIVPHYFAWFVSPACCVRLRTMAKDVLWKCLQVAEFQECVKTYSGHSSSPQFTVHNAMSYYSMKPTHSQDFYHVTACFTPRRKYLAGSPYHKSPAVVKALGQISLVTITGCVVTNNTFSARVSLTKKQRVLWMNDDIPEQLQKKRGHTTRHAPYSVEEVTSSLQHLPLEDGAATSEVVIPDEGVANHTSTHITLGKRRDVSPVQAKYDVQTVVNHEFSSRACQEYTLYGDIGKVRKYSDDVWAVYFNKAHVFQIPAIFSGNYD